MSQDDIDASSAPLIDHLVELRQRLMRSVIAIFVFFVVCFFFANPIFNLLVIPYERAAGESTNLELIFTAPQEFFFVQVKIAFFGALFLAFPVIATQIYKFVAPGLYRNERGAFLPFLVATPILFLIGAAIVYFLIMPLAMMFFLSMQQTGVEGAPTIKLLPRVSEYLGLIMTLIFAFGLMFQLPVVMTLLARAGLVTSETLAAKRKWAIVLSFVAAAILTPPDPLSQISLAVPTILLYEISVYAARIVERRQRERQAAQEKTEAGAAAS
ncbi:MAG: Sec-independent protein translocase protein TatC [Alphaproteobacteria bacterium]|nr:MAG: Sec-independent protein translocase protein TatC [Alphaproteobacteria bacterium]